MKIIAQKPLEQVRQEQNKQAMQQQRMTELERSVMLLSKNPDEIYRELNIWDQNLTVEAVREAKDQQLNYLCNQSILDGFTYAIEADGQEYKFSYDVEAQLNFQGAIVLATAGQLTEMEWTARNAEGEIVRVVLKASDFQKLAAVMVQHKNSNVSKYRNDLSPKLAAAETKEEIDGINW